jgi:cell wall-associated NlpC family hydrolase
MPNRAGQFGVVRTNSVAAWLIRLGTRSQVNHAFVFIDEDFIVEAEGTGAVISRASKYADMTVSHFPLTDAEAAAIGAEARKLVGTPYGYLDIACLTLLSLGVRWQWLLDRAQASRTLICSQLVDRAYRNAGLHLYDDGRPDGEVTPGDLLVLLAERAALTRPPPMRSLS